MSMQERLQKVIAHAGIASRREAERLIEQGEVAVNGTVVTKLGTKVDPASDIITVDGSVVNTSPEKLYVVLNKPAGYVSTLKDPQNRPIVMDLLERVGQMVLPADYV